MLMKLILWTRIPQDIRNHLWYPGGVVFKISGVENKWPEIREKTVLDVLLYSSSVHFNQIELQRKVAERSPGTVNCTGIFTWLLLFGLFWLFTYWQIRFELSREKFYRKWCEGKWKLLQVSERFEFPSVKWL